MFIKTFIINFNASQYIKLRVQTYTQQLKIPNKRSLFVEHAYKFMDGIYTILD